MDAAGAKDNSADPGVRGREDMTGSVMIGIDAGGTYTDAVLIRMNTDPGKDEKPMTVLASGKALTTYPDPIGGIRNVLDLFDPEMLKAAGKVCVSTTFATNAVLEKNIAPVGLVLIGEQKEPDDRVGCRIKVAGGYDHNGKEAAELDEESIRAFVGKTKDSVSAYAVSAVFGVFNTEHEIRAKQIITEMTGYPVVCGHELTRSLGAHERALTSYLNASLLPVAKSFTDAVVSEVRSRGIGGKIMMIKCNGASADLSDVMEKPVETVFSGPAASLTGAAVLSGHETCIAADIGGTSTDVSMITEGFPEISESGAMVAGWQTKVRALKIETVALGGDSHVRLLPDDDLTQAPHKNAGNLQSEEETVDTEFRNPVISHTRNEIIIGPGKVIPLCRASVMYPGFLKTLRLRWVPHNQVITEFIQPTMFYVKNEICPVLTDEEESWLSRLGTEPAAVSEKVWEKTYIPPEILSSLIRKRAVSVIGFTPTDALHVLGDFTEWDEKASEAGAVLIANLLGMNKVDFCRFIKRKVVLSIATELIHFMDGKVSREKIMNFLERNEHVFFSTDIPIVLIGASAEAYREDLEKLLRSKVTVPEEYDVGNAVGTLFGKLSRRIDLDINISVSETKAGYVEKDVCIFTEDGPFRFRTSEEAVDFAKTYSRRKITEYIERNGGRPETVRFGEKMSSHQPDPMRPPVQITIVTTGVAGTE